MNISQATWTTLINMIETCKYTEATLDLNQQDLDDNNAIELATALAKNKYIKSVNSMALR